MRTALTRAEPQRATEYDVAIIGGSFAGLYLASILSKSLRVCVIERESSVDSVMLTTGSTFLLPDKDVFSLFPAARLAIIAEYTGFELRGTTQRLSYTHETPVWVLLDVARFKRDLVNHCGNVDFFFSTAAGELKMEGGVYTQVAVQSVNTSARARKAAAGVTAIKAKVFVDASGSSGVLIRQVRRPSPKRIASCYQVDAVSSKRFDQHRVLLFPIHEYCPGGYAYVFPITPTRVRIGICAHKERLHGTPITDNFKRFLTDLDIELRNPSNVLERDISMGGYERQNYHCNLIAIGDSAGHLSPLIGEGIRFAMHAGNIAAPLIQSYIQGDAKAFRRFGPLWQQRFGGLFPRAYLFQTALVRLTPARIDTLFKRVQSYAARDPDVLLRIVSSRCSTFDMLRIGVRLVA